jgi:hypothetical protein
LEVIASCAGASKVTFGCYTVFEEMTFFNVKLPTKTYRKSEDDNETLNSGIGYEIN